MSIMHDARQCAHCAIGKLNCAYLIRQVNINTLHQIMQSRWLTRIPQVMARRWWSAHTALLQSSRRTPYTTGPTISQWPRGWPLTNSDIDQWEVRNTCLVGGTAEQSTHECDLITYSNIMALHYITILKSNRTHHATHNVHASTDLPRCAQSGPFVCIIFQLPPHQLAPHSHHRPSGK